MTYETYRNPETTTTTTEAPKPSQRSVIHQNRQGKRMRTTTTRAPRTTPRTTTVVPTTVTQTTVTPETTTMTSKKSSFLDLFGIFGKKKEEDQKMEMKDSEYSESPSEEDMMIKKSPESLVFRDREKEKENGKKPKFRTTVTPPSTPEAPPPWISTTSTVATTTTVFTTHAPLPIDGCVTKDANGREIFTHIGAVMRVSWGNFYFLQFFFEKNYFQIL